MIKIQIKNRFTGSIIFEYSKENNTISETVKEYIRKEIAEGKSSADLSYADLSYANLSYADLSSADLSSADLSYANLSYANLSYADLRSADLSSADLRYANLRSADLSSADLRYANLDKKYIQIACIGSAKRITTYCFEDDLVWCGCFKGTLKEFEAKVKETHSCNELHLSEYMGAIKYIKSLQKFVKK